MLMKASRVIAALATGASAGLAAGLLGIGGGLVIVPLLSLWFATPLKRAIGSSLAGVLVIASAAVVTEWVVARHNQHLVIAALLAVGAVAGAWLGSGIVTRISVGRLQRLLALLLLLAALKMSGLAAWLSLDVPWQPASSGHPAISVLTHVGAGLLAGVISAMFGVGGGILVVPVLHILHPDWTFQACRATSLLMIIPTALAGAFLHGKLKHVDRGLVLGLVPGSLAGVIAGVVLANRVPGRPLELVFAGLLLLTSARMFHRRAR